eukprot:scaffold1090_cov244-Chaetoceros_neogracile.AAC.14
MRFSSSTVEENSSKLVRVLLGVSRLYISRHDEKWWLKEHPFCAKLESAKEECEQPMIIFWNYSGLGTAALSASIK